jgi:Rieske Fe-S protein
MQTAASSRRGFVNFLMGGGFGAMAVWMLYPVIRYLIPPQSGEPTIASVAVPWKPAEIKANSGRIFKFGSQPGLLVKTPAGELRAFAATCTHLNCTVQYREEKQDICAPAQRHLRPEREERQRPTAATLRLQGQPEGERV